MSKFPQSYGTWTHGISMQCKDCGGSQLFECDDADPSVGINFPQCSMSSRGTCSCHLSADEIDSLEEVAAYQMHEMMHTSVGEYNADQL